MMHTVRAGCTRWSFIFQTIHLVGDADHLGSLRAAESLPFENNIAHIKAAFGPTPMRQFSGTEKTTRAMEPQSILEELQNRGRVLEAQSVIDTKQAKME